MTATAYLVHFKQGALSHLLESTNFPSFLFSSKEDFSISTLADLGDDVELIHTESRSSLSENDSFSSAVGFKFGGSFGGCKTPFFGIGVEHGPSFFTRRDVTEELEVIVEEIWVESGSGNDDQQRPRSENGFFVATITQFFGWSMKER